MACASTPRAEVREIVTRSETGASQLDTQTTAVDASVEGQLGADFQYRLNERLIQTRSTLEAPGIETEEDLLSSQPSLDMVLDAGSLRWIQGYEVQDTKTQASPGATNDQLRANLLERFEWSPTDLPRLVAWFNVRTNTDSVALDREVLESALQIDDRRGAFSWNYSVNNQDEQDKTSSIDTDRLRQILRLGHEDQYLDGALSSRASLYFEERDFERRSSGGTIPSGQVTPVVGLSSLDTTPLIATLGSNPALTDGDLSTPAGINIGGFTAGGDTFWNVGLESPSGQLLNVALLYTASPVPSAFENGFNFAVYGSDDNLFWDLLDSSASYSYERALQRFRILLPNVESRYVKVVNTASPAAVGAVQVAELEVYAPATGTGGAAFSQASDESIQNGTLGLAWRVTDTVTLGYDLFAQQAGRDDNGVMTRDEQRLDNALSLRWKPVERADLTVRGESRIIDDRFQGGEDYQALSGMADYRPLDTLDVAASYTLTSRDRETQGVEDTSGVQMRTSAQLLAKLQADVTFEVSQIDDEGAERVLDRTIWGAQLIAEISRHIQITLGFRNQDSRLSGVGAVGLPDPSETQYETDLIWRPSEQITGEARLLWRETYAGAGLDQRLRLDWTPFQEGAIDILLDAQRIVSGAIDEQLDRYLLQARWTANRSTYMDINWSVEMPENAERTDVISASLNVRL